MPFQGRPNPTDPGDAADLSTDRVTPQTSADLHFLSMNKGLSQISFP
jgi:hypothetical protein